MTSNLIKIESTPDLVEQVYTSLLDAISDGSLPPGARIMQEDIAEQLAVSRQPVLQALRLLRKDGFVRDAPGRGVLVAPLDVNTLVQIYQVRRTADAAFHSAIYVASGNPLIAQTAQTHWHHIRRAMGAVLQASTMRESIWDEHQAIAKAIACGAATEAETLIRQHAEDAGQNLAHLLTAALFQKPFKNHLGDTS